MKTIYKLNVIIVIIGLLSSCQYVLEKVPLNAPSDETFFSNKTELELAINGAYNDLYWTIASCPTPMVLDNTTDIGFLRTDWDGMQTFSRGAHTSETFGFSRIWEKMYSGINRCNNLLENMERAKEAVTDEFYQRIQAEAKFLRAYYYFWLIQFYGDVPYVTSIPENIDTAKIPRTPKNQIVENLLADLDFAIQILPESWGGNDEGRATKGAALTLKARIALMNENYEVTINASSQVIDMGVYSLYPDYEKLFQYAGERSNEVILDMPFKVGFSNTNVPREQGSRNASGWSRIVPSQFMIDSYECIDGLPIDESPLYDPSYPFKNRDPRLDASIIRPHSEYAGYIYETNRDSVVCTRFVNGVATKVPNQDALNPYASFTGYLWRKYTSEEDVPSNVASSELNFILMRYAEVLLTYAEAKIELGAIDKSVLDAINLVRARAYGVDKSESTNYPSITTMDQEELRKIIRRERKIELADEGFRLLDIRRWRIAENVMQGTFIGRPNGAYVNMTNVPDINKFGHPVYGTAKDLYRAVDQRSFDPNRDYLWPIPQKAIDVNDQLVQNPGY